MNFVRKDVEGIVLAEFKTKLECEKEQKQLVDNCYQLQRIATFKITELSNNLGLDAIVGEENHVHCEERILQGSHQFAENYPEGLVFR